MPIPPIEQESYQRLRSRLPRSGVEPSLPSGPALAVIERVAHATADLELAMDILVDEGATLRVIEALSDGCAVIADTEMVRVGMTGLTPSASCYLSEAREPDGRYGTRSAAAIELAAQRHRVGALWVIGCAPTALEALCDQIAAGRVEPVGVIALPVGFVGAVEAKARAREMGVATVSNRGERGGAAAAAAATNALRRYGAWLETAAPRPGPE